MTAIAEPVFVPHWDAARIRGQMQRIYALMQDQAWRSLREIAEVTGDPEASISADLRSFRKAQFGGHTVERRRRGEPLQGLWEYRLLAR